VRKQLGPYLEQKILAATPLELVTISYQCASQAVRDARAALAEGSIAERSSCITLAHGIIAELYRSLDRSVGDGSLPNELGRLYDYMMRQLLVANSTQTDAPLAEVLDLLTSLAEAWVRISSDPAAAQAAPHAQPLKAVPSPAGNTVRRNDPPAAQVYDPPAARPVSTPSRLWGIPDVEPEESHYSVSF
jgi:flagellar protein FliS